MMGDMVGDDGILSVLDDMSSDGDKPLASSSV